MEDATDRPSYEPEPAQDPTPSTQAKYSAVQRLWMMFMSPGEVFADIGIKPTWAVLLAVLVILGIAYQAVVVPHVDIEGTIRARVAEQDQPVSESQIQGAVKFAEVIARLGPVIVPVFWMVIAATFFFLMLKLVGSEADYPRAFSTTLHAYWPPTIVALVLTSILIQKVGKVQEDELARLVKANIGAFMSPDAPAWLTSVASTISVFNLWAVILLFMGFATVGKLSKGKAAAVALVPWVAWIIVKAGLTALFA
jgi:hypothetical protein